jgi:hypothetical protein
MLLKPNQRVTLILINDLGVCIRREVEIQEFLDGPTRKIKYRKKGARASYTSILEDSTLIFQGWNLELRVDTDAEGPFLGLRVHNFTGPSDTEIKRYVLSENLNDRFTQLKLIHFRGIPLKF